MLIFIISYLHICVMKHYINKYFLFHQQTFRMKKIRKQASINKDSESWDVPFSRVYYKSSLISVLWSYKESHTQSNVEMKMEIIMEDQNKEILTELKEIQLNLKQSK